MLESLNGVCHCGAVQWHARGVPASATTCSCVVFHFCSDCGCLAYWRALKPDGQGRFAIGFNLRLSEPAAVAAIPIVRHDGLNSTDDLPRDGRCVEDFWF